MISNYLSTEVTPGDIIVLIRSDFDKYDTRSRRSRQRQYPYARIAPTNNKPSACSTYTWVCVDFASEISGGQLGLVCSATLRVELSYVPKLHLHRLVQVWSLSSSAQTYDARFLSMDQTLGRPDLVDPQPSRGVSTVIEVWASNEACTSYANMFDTQKHGTREDTHIINL